MVKPLMALTIGLGLTGSAVFVSPKDEVETHFAPRDSRVDLYRERASEIGDVLSVVETFYKLEIAPVERVISKKNPKHAREIAWSLVVHARKHDIPVSFALGILMVENPDFALRARSSAGAIGLTQVMPFHAGKWKCGRNLYDIDTNICTGFKIFKHSLAEEKGDLRRALLRYNGCVRGSRTPNCKSYPKWVNTKMLYAERQLASHGD
jgi:soluble lytic murein transglycosylase-like protein